MTTAEPSVERDTATSDTAELVAACELDQTAAAGGEELSR